MGSWKKRIAVLFVLFYCALMFASLLWCFRRSVFFDLSNGFIDMFISYEGGFVRRGLFGEILVLANRYCAVDPYFIIVPLIIVCYCAVAVYLLRGFRKRGYAPFVLLSCFMLGSLASYSPAGIRRDFILLALLLSLTLMFKHLKAWKFIAFGNLLAIVGILFHESFTLLAVPCCVALTHTKGLSWVRSVASWLPALVCFALVCTLNGNMEQANAIWAAAQEVLGYDKSMEMPYLLQFLGFKTTDVMWTHFSGNYLRLHYGVPSFVTQAVVFCTVFYMTCNAPMSLGKSAKDGQLNKRIAPIAMFQFIVLLPMFTVLCTDFGRITTWWSISTLLILLCLRKDDPSRLLPEWFNRFAVACLMRLNSLLKPTKRKLFIVFLCFGVPLIGGSWVAVFLSSPIGWSVMKIISALGKVFAA